MVLIQENILPLSFYTRSDVVQIARDLVGKVLVTNFEGVLTSGLIVETEAYAGIEDRASHAYGGLRSKRTEIMFLPGGIAYVYLCYGIHSLFNVVTNGKDIPHAVLIRGINPLDGIDKMLKRNKREKPIKNMGIGPGRLSALLGIHYSHSGKTITAEANENHPEIWIEDRGIELKGSSIKASPRIGVDYAGQDALLPYRFVLNTK
ncbi:MAG: DNA-3-methyladenine glycosylase [Bacteroidales bacterium]|nr:DNA-3-methyladenine glycosylase [Bacteroidales bacterium]